MKIILCLLLFLPQIGISAERILVFGDSLSAGYGIPAGKGWVDLFSIKPEYTVVNASISGETSFGGEKRIGEVLLREKPQVVILELGANDGLRGGSVEAASRNLESIIVQCKKEKAKVLLVGMRLPPNYGGRYSQAFAAMYPSLAKKHRTALVPFLFEGFAEKRELFQADNIHPNEKAQPLILENVLKYLRPLLGR